MDLPMLFLNYDVFLSLKVLLIIANSADPGEMQHNAAFYMGLQCLPMYPFRSFENTKWLNFHSK